MMKQKNYSDDPLIHAITTEEILGKDVIDPEGKYIGVSDRLFVNPDNLQLIGLSIDQGFMRKSLVISINHISKVTKHAIILDQRPVVHLKGMIVFDIKGHKIGYVTDIIRPGKKNFVDAIVVKTSYVSRTKKIIPSKLIDRISDNIILKVSKEDIKTETPAQTQ